MCVYLDDEKVRGVINIFAGTNSEETFFFFFFSFLRTRVVWLTGGEDSSVSFPSLCVLFLQRGFDSSIGDTDKFSCLINENESRTVWKPHRRWFVPPFVRNEMESATLWSSAGESSTTVNQRWSNTASRKTKSYISAIYHILYICTGIFFPTIYGPFTWGYVVF